MAPATTPSRSFSAPAVLAVLAVCLSLPTAWAQSGPTAAENESSIQPGELQDWVHALSDESYHRRQAAADKLRERASQGGAVGEAVIAALRLGLENSSMETRIASERILQTLALSAFDDQIDQLLNPHVLPDGITMAGWKPFSEMAGSDFAARSLFSRIALRHDRFLRRMQLPAADDSFCDAIPDPYTLRSDDAVSWALALLSDSRSDPLQQTNAFSKITVSLSNSAMGPKLRDANDATVLRRMISHWIGNHPRRGTTRQRILIAMRYSCDQRAGELCDQVLADPDALPTSQVTAMLAASAMQRPNLRPQLIARLSDERTAHVWQLIASRQTKIRTQVRDVALALLLRLHQTDPREAGFEELQADPLLIFRDHSLGFANDASRAAAHVKGLALVGLDEPVSKP
jgi:hypothetical protein